MTIALVRDVISDSSRVSSMFKVSERMSANTGLAPRKTYALIDDTKVNDGTITSSPGPTSSKSADISSAEVQDVVRRTLATPNDSSSRVWQRLVNGPSPDNLLLVSASVMYRSSLPSRVGSVKGIEPSGKMWPVISATIGDD